MYLMTMNVVEDGKKHNVEMVFNSKENAIKRAHEYFINSVGTNIQKKEVIGGDSIYKANIIFSNCDDTVDIIVREIEAEDEQESTGGKDALFEVPLIKEIKTTVNVVARSLDEAKEKVKNALEENEYEFCEEYFRDFYDDDFQDSGWCVNEKA